MISDLYTYLEEEEPQEEEEEACRWQSIEVV
jgi:hypothetical protein